MSYNGGIGGSMPTGPRGSRQRRSIKLSSRALAIAALLLSIGHIAWEVVS